MVTQEALDKMAIRQDFSNVWHTDLMNAIADDPSYCCLATLCPHCVSYLLRKRALYDDMSRYTCCGGYMPCSGKCAERKCPEFCLCIEVFLCFANSVASTRFMLQDEFNIQTTQCDNCIIGFMFCLQQLACIFSIAACLTGIDELEEASQLLSCLSDLVYCSVCSCMQTQHKREMDKRDGNFGPQPIMAPPSPQHMSRIDQPYPPPSSGYPPPPPTPPVYQQMYGYPPPANPYGYPPPAHGYPASSPSGYPASSPSGYPAPPPSGYPATPPSGYPAPSPKGYPEHSPDYPQHSAPSPKGYPEHSPDYPQHSPPNPPAYPANPPGYPQHSPPNPPAYPANPPGYPQHSPPNPPAYPANPPGYPQHSPQNPSAYPANPPGYPQHSPNYPSNPPAYPANPPGYPQHSPGYPGPGADYAPPPPKSDSK